MMSYLVARKVSACRCFGADRLARQLVKRLNAIGRQFVGLGAECRKQLTRLLFRWCVFCACCFLLYSGRLWPIVNEVNKERVAV